MKRKITQLEQYLNDNGYQLSHKIYQGKYSQFTKTYCYSKMIGQDICNVRIYLDKKREKVLEYFIEYFGLINYEMAMQIMAIADSIKEMLAKYE